MFEFEIGEAACKYLYIQRGEVAGIKEFEPWKRAYEDSIDAIYQSIKSYIRPDIKRTLDIGSGLGGINAVLNRHVGGGLHVNLLDGESDLPVVERHNKTFNDMQTARDFLFDNGVMNLSTHDPMTYEESLSGEFDLITSFASYGFHVHPKTYILLCRRRAALNGIMVFDVRRTPGDEWLTLFSEEFGPPTVVAEGKKYQRCVFHPSNRSQPTC